MESTTNHVPLGRRTRTRVVGAVVVLLLAASVSACAGRAPTRLVDLPESSPSQEATTPTPTPTTTTDVVVVTEVIAFERTTQDDPTRDVGTSAIVQQGVEGTRSITYTVTYLDGVEIDRVATDDAVTVAPIPEITAVGSRQPAPAPIAGGGGGCDPNYAGACVPIASDVDCAGGSGNGPAYVRGPVRVIGVDIYDLDRDGDGIACD
ncbi:MAG: G5 domain-containing protein [Protaetiibacter sp.]